MNLPTSRVFYVIMAVGVLPSPPLWGLALDSSALSAALDSPADWKDSSITESPVLACSVVEHPASAHTGDSYLLLGSTEAIVELEVTGPGVAQVWVKPQGFYRNSTQRAQLAVVGGQAAVVTATGSYAQSASFPWQRAEVVVPAGPQTLRLQSLDAIGSPFTSAMFDGFSYTPANILLTIASSLEAQTSTPFSVAAIASTAATFSATDLPAGLQIDPVTGEITGTPTTVGVTTATITATGAAGSDSQQVTFTVAPPLGQGTDQPTWTWRTATTPSQAWRFVSEGGSPLSSSDGVDAIETLNFTAEDSWVEVDVEGPGWITWVQRAAQGQHGAGSTIAVVVDGVPVGPPLQPPLEYWGERQVWIPAQRHTVRWTARLKPATLLGPGHADGPARIDQVRFTPDTPVEPDRGTLHYADWAASLPVGARGYDDDGDGNGVSNWDEYSFGPPAGLPWPPAAALSTDGDWRVFSAGSHAAAADGHWSFELLHPAIPGYPAGWSAASVWAKTFSRQTGRLEARVTRVVRQAGGPVLGGLYTAEPAPPLIIGRFVCRATPVGP